MKCFMDFHTHTIAGGHAYSTLQENIASAMEQGLKFLGYSEHGPMMPGGPHFLYFKNMKVLPREFGNLKLFCGVEANIMDYNGTLDLEEELLSKLDYCIASLHTLCCKPGTVEENTRAVVGAMKNPYVTILGHPDDSRYPLDYEVVVKTAKEEKVLLEVNNSSMDPKNARQNGRENVVTLLRTCMKYDCPIVLGSDAHFSDAVGNFAEVLNVIEEVGFPKKLIVNADPEGWKKVVRGQ